MAGAVLALTTLCGCGGGGGASSDPESASASPSAPTSLSASAPASTPSTTSASTSASTPTAGAAFAQAEVVGLHDVAYRAANKERAQNDQYFATDPARVAALLDTVATHVPDVLSSHPAGATVHLAYVIAPYDSSQLTCAPDGQTLEFLMVVGKDGVAFTTIVSTNTGTSFRIFDSARAGHKPFDKNGFNIGSGGCATTGSVQAIAYRDIPLP